MHMCFAITPLLLIKSTRPTEMPDESRNENKIDTHKFQSYSRDEKSAQKSILIHSGTSSCASSISGSIILKSSSALANIVCFDRECREPSAHAITYDLYHAERYAQMLSKNSYNLPTDHNFDGFRPRLRSNSCLPGHIPPLLLLLLCGDRDIHLVKDD